MRAFCAPLKCLSFLAGKKPPEYNPVDGGSNGIPDAEENDEDDFFGDDWGSEATPRGASASSKTSSEELKLQGGIERNPSRETTKQRGSGSGSAAAAAAPAAAAPEPKKKPQNDDIFGELGMEINYQAPRVLDSSKNRGAPTASVIGGGSVGDLLGDANVEAAAGAWGGDDLDLKL
eukprot:gnl/TRDRNA2_/TRDRNA2_44069_c0_seq1.p1 gnl/TRDRNA2_/TRDRNA2_44069_c0~~gnl/TRDRNA2_/TRDRNA2_44069_c0_seq1.p1  ORF type:complete len:176 (+),score=56.89 gnl/TRDRNA2_/TRDRNA2_44069_c0_seq1:52-579(+)